MRTTVIRATADVRGDDAEEEWAFETERARASNESEKRTKVQCGTEETGAQHE